MQFRCGSFGSELPQVSREEFLSSFESVVFDRSAIRCVPSSRNGLLRGRIPNLIFLQPRKTPTPWAYHAGFLRRILEESYIPDYFEEARFWLVDTEADDEGDRKLNLVDLQSVAPMADREFIRRIAALRTAWRLHLSNATKKPRRPSKPDDRQDDLDFKK